MPGLEPRYCQYATEFVVNKNFVIIARCIAALRQLRQIRRSVPPDTFQSLIVSLVISRLDYGNAVLVGLPVHLVRRLQSVLNAAARLIYHMRSADHIIADILLTLLACKL